MAKQLVSPVERHIEKVVFGVALLVLLGAVVQYLITSPNQIELDGERITPQTVEEFVFSKADRIRTRIRDANVEVETPEPLVDQFSASLSPLPPNAKWPLVASIRPEVPLVDKAGQVAGQYELVEVMPLPKPAVTHGRSTYIIERPSGTAYIPANWVTVSSIVDVREQTSRQRLAYGATRADLIYGPVEGQRREQRPDGSWSDDDWELLQSWRIGDPLPEPPEIKLREVDGRVETEPGTLNKLNGFVGDLKKELAQLELLRPIIPEIENGVAWSFPIITSCYDVLKQDDEVLYPNEPPATDPDDRYGVCRVGGEGAQAANAAARTRQIFDNAEALLKAAKRAGNVNDAMVARNSYNEVIRDPQSSAADKQKAKTLQLKAEQIAKDIERENRIRASLALKETSDEDEIDQPAREKLPIQQVWVNDARPNRVESGKTYQYRIRLNLFNRLAGDPAKFRDPEDAKRIYVAGDWSEPSDPVSVMRDVEFYVVSQDPRDDKVGVRINRWYEGVWVESRKFQLAVGDPVAGRVRAEVPDLEDPRKADRALVDFDGGAVVIDLDFDRLIRERKRGGGREGVRFADRTKGVCAVALVDSHGTLTERFLPIDKEDPSLRAAQSRKWKPSK